MKGFIFGLIAVALTGTASANGYRQVIRTAVAAPSYAPSCGVQQSFSYGVQQAPICAPSCGVQQAPIYAPSYAPACGVGQSFSYGVQQSFAPSYSYRAQQEFLRQQELLRQRAVFRQRGFADYGVGGLGLAGRVLRGVGRAFIPGRAFFPGRGFNRGVFRSVRRFR